MRLMRLMQGWNTGTASKPAHILGVLAGAFVFLGCVGMSGADASMETENNASNRAPMLLDREKLAGVGLTEWPPLTDEDVISGGKGHRGEVFFNSDQIVVEVWEADASTLAVREPQGYDEFVLILSGKLVLTDAQGEITEYSAGDSLVVPQGFSGTWQMIGNYRELIVIEKKAYDIAEGAE